MTVQKRVPGSRIVYDGKGVLRLEAADKMGNSFPFLLSPMWRSRTFWRLFGASGGLVLVALGLLGVVVVQRVERYEQEQIEQTLHAKAMLVQEIVRGRSREQLPWLRQRVADLRPQVGVRITLMDADGWVLADSDEDPDRIKNHAERPEVRQAQATGLGTAIRFSATVGRSMKYVALRADQSEQAATIVRVALPLDHLEEQLADLRRLVWTAVAITALAALFLAFILARCITRPIQELTEGVARASAGDFGKRVYPLSRDEVGTLARAFNEMSERLATQFRQLEEDRQQLRAVLSGMVEGVVALDVEQRIVFANERATQLLDFPMPAAIGRRLWEVVRQRPLQDLVERALAGSESASQELSWNNPAARSLTVHVAQFAGSSMRGAVLVLHDTSELRRLERLRQDFVANVSHELKTPLAVIKAAVETLLDGAVEDAANRGAFLEQIADQSERLHALILDLLSLARIEAGTEAFEFQAVALGPLVADCVERHRARAEARGQLLRIAGCGLQFDQGKPQAATHKPQWGVAWADEEAVTQILDNLVDNALKYTPEGGQITIRWGESDGQACLEVEDTGIGIPERDLSRIFERFYRVDKARSRELGGTGLGLAIVKHLVQAMNGSIRARSQLGKGTIFSVWLPREPAV